MRIIVVLGIAALPIGGVSEGIASGMDIRLPVFVCYAAAVLGSVAPVPFLMAAVKYAAERIGGLGRSRGRRYAAGSRAIESGEKTAAAGRETAAFICAAMPFIPCALWIGAAVAAVSDISPAKGIIILLLGSIVSGLIFLVAAETCIFA